MKQHEREFFISTIRSGNIVVKKDNITIVIKPLTIDQSVESCYIYNEAYKQSYIDGMMDEGEMEEWMREQGLWLEEDDKVLEALKKDLEKLKIEIYNARNNSQLKDRIRLYLRKCESETAKYLTKKNSYYQNTREGYAANEKAAWVIKNSSYKNSSLYDFNELSLQYVMDEWQSSILTDSQTRELARNEPWRSLWVIKDNTKIKLFNNLENTELTFNQKNLIIWSQMYDNIQESVECPPKDVIEDDDMLDGWFIVQSKKREQEKLASEIEHNSKNEKIKNASEVYMMAQNNEDISRIDSMNDAHGLNVKKQRTKSILQKGTVNHHDLADERLKLQMQQTNQMRGKLKGG
jgi:hypothetical protein